MQESYEKTIEYESTKDKTEHGKSVRYSFGHTSEEKEFLHFKVELSMFKFKKEKSTEKLEVLLEEIFNRTEKEIMDCFRSIE
ncbi:MAG: hypothetical protein FWD48_01050 [Oscillospiraceae bacterium]|nr:hypothetical protein [Oscillospiraceae bacterium]